MKLSIPLRPFGVLIGLCAGLTLAYPMAVKAADAPPQVSKDGLQLKTHTKQRLVCPPLPSDLSHAAAGRRRRHAAARSAPTLSAAPTGAALGWHEVVGGEFVAIATVGWR